MSTRQSARCSCYKLEMARSKFSWALIPISVPFIWLLFFWRRDVGLYDHAIFAFHSLSFMTLLGGRADRARSDRGPPGLAVARADLRAADPHVSSICEGAYLAGRFGALWRTATLAGDDEHTAGSLFFTLLLWLRRTSAATP